MACNKYKNEKTLNFGLSQCVYWIGVQIRNIDQLYRFDSRQQLTRGRQLKTPKNNLFFALIGSLGFSRNFVKFVQNPKKIVMLCIDWKCCLFRNFVKFV